MSPVARAIARWLVALAAGLIVIGTLAGLAGCGGNSDAPPPPPPPPGQTVGPVDCSRPQTCT